MIARVAHRGPDARGAWADEHVALAHARLSLVDLEGGAQPMHTADGRLSLVFNGEIYNHVELREQLEARGHRFRTRSDTEVILHQYEEDGPACVERFNGQWALALWDRDARRLFLARDPMGIRPLFYTRAGASFVFASEVKALFAAAGVERALSVRDLADTMTFWTPLPDRTVFTGVSQLPPGHSLLVDENGERRARTFELDFAPDESRSLADAAEELRALLEDATRLRMRADVPVAAYLSGGLDSSITTALARPLARPPLHTFSVTFDDGDYDESPFQEEVARALGTEHHAVACGQDDLAHELPDVVWHAEAPLFRTAPAPLFRLSRLVRQSGIKAVLTGEGADEVLAGYDLFREAKVRRRWARAPSSARWPALLARLYPYLPDLQRQSPAYLRAFFHARPEKLASPWFSHLPRWEVSRRAHLFLSPDARAQLADHDPYEALAAWLPARFSAWEPLAQAQALEMMLLLPGYILSSQGDRMSMAHGVEGRYPFLDPRVVAAAARMPGRYKLRALDEKHVLKRALGHLVPARVVRRKKQPYRAPEAEALLSPTRAGPEWLHAVLADERLRHGGAFHPPAVRKLCEKARARGLTTFRDNLAFLSVVSTQVLLDRFVHTPFA